MIALSLQQQVARARQASDQLFAILAPDALYQRPIAERHRLIFYLGHLEAFDRNLLAGQRVSRFPELDRLFAFGIDPTDGKLPNDAPQDWPDRQQVEEYLRHTRAEVDGLLAENSLQKQQVALEHRWMHCETLAYLFHRLPYAQKIPQTQESLDVPMIPKPQWRQVPAGATQLGQSSPTEFGWDNEFGAQTLEVPAFEMESLPVSNAAFLEFLEAGGYGQRELWSEGDWQWKEAAGIQHPGFWSRQSDGWRYQGMFAEIPLPLSWPVYVSHAEACAYARWRNLRLPTEAQFQRAAYAQPLDLSGANLDFRHWEPRPIGSDPSSDSSFGISELVGNGWEWTCTPFAPLPGFQAFDFYKGYSADFFDNKHYVLKGASARTAMCLTRPSFRNWFQPHYPHVYAKFRCVRP